jgi:hypothetical protein
MVEIFNSLLSNYKSKIRNPFFGTLASVWLIRNWYIVYAIFNFDKDCSMQDKINYIQDYFSHKDFGLELFHNLWVSFVVMGFTYILLAFSRAITDLYYKWLEPLIITKIDKKAIYTTPEKMRLEGRISLLDKKLVKSESDLSNHIIEIDKANNEYGKLSNDKNSEIEKLTNAIAEQTKLNKISALTYNQLQEYFDNLNLPASQMQLIENFENKEIKKIVSPGSDVQAYWRLINAGLVSNDEKYIELTILGKVYLKMRNYNKSS